MAGQRTGEDGRFRLSIQPGQYVVTATSDRAMFCDEQRITVAMDRFTPVTVSCDTGMR